MKQKQTTLLCTLLCILMLASCGPKSRRDEIEQRKEALKHKQDSTLTAAQEELAWVDSALQAAIARHDRLQQQLNTGRHTATQMKQLDQQLTDTRLQRDSLQVRFEVLCGIIKYIHRRQNEHRDSTRRQ